MSHRTSEITRLQLEVGVAERAHLRNIETGKFGFRADALSHYNINEPVDDKG